MKILLVNTFDRGGAANACLRLHEGLLDKGVESRVLLKQKHKDIPETYQFRNLNRPKSIFQKLKQKSLTN